MVMSSNHELFPDLIQSLYWYVEQYIIGKWYIIRKGVLRRFLFPQDYSLVVKPRWRTIWDNVRTKTNQRWHIYSGREDPLIMDADVGN